MSEIQLETDWPSSNTEPTWRITALPRGGFKVVIGYELDRYRGDGAFWYPAASLVIRKEKHLPKAKIRLRAWWDDYLSRESLAVALRETDE